MERTNEGLKRALEVLSKMFSEENVPDGYHSFSKNEIVQIGQVVTHARERIEELEQL